MEFLFSGFFDLPWWGYVAVALALTHVTTLAVTLYLHRCQAHRALEFHPALAHFFRFWLWLTTGMVTREWAAVHRKHHAKCETAHDPHSPKVLGIHRVLWGGVFLYVKEARSRQTLERYGQGSPEDWIERNVYGRCSFAGVLVLLAGQVLAFGVVPGALIWLVQVAWIPFWAAGVINGVGHFGGYRNWPTEDASRNIVPWGILMGGEELHNNHHAYPTSARLSNRWYELDIGWMYVRIFELVGLAKAKRVAAAPRLVAPRPAVDLQTLQAIIRHRYDVLASYAKAMKRVGTEDGHALQTMAAMRAELAGLWERSMASGEELLRQLQLWCRRAEESGIRPLAQFAQRLRSYA